MAFDYARLALKAKAQLLDKGRLVTLQKLGNNPVDDYKPWAGGNNRFVVKEVQNVAAAFVPAAGRDLGEYSIDSELLKRVEFLVMLSPVSDDLAEMHLLVDNGVTYKIDWMQTLRPANVTLLFYAGIKK